MNYIPRIKSKFTMPVLNQGILISKNFRLLYDRMENKNAVVICAPAGYGKTAFLCSYFTEYSFRYNRTYWYNLDQDDRKPEAFLSYLIEAFFPSGKEIAFKALNESINGHFDMQYVISTICQRLWEYYNSTQAESISLVLDNFQYVYDVTEILDAVRYLLDNLPPNYSIVISSRYAISIFSEKQKLDRSILELDMNSLLFSKNDIELFYSDIEIAIGNKKLIEKIAEYTEGWISGIVIIHNYLQVTNSLDIEDLTQTIKHMDIIPKYFGSEVLSKLDNNLLSLLAKLSILYEFTVEEARIILDMADITEVMEKCIEFGAFIYKKPMGKITLYRFHFLFREALLKIQQDFITAEDLKAYYLKAAQYYMTNKIYSKGIEYLLCCKDIKLINEIILKESIHMDIFEGVDQLLMMFEILPESIVADNAVLLFIKGLIYQHNRFEDSLGFLKMAFERSARDCSFILRMKIALALIYAYNSKNDMKSIVKLLSQIQKPAVTDDSTSVEMTVKAFEMFKAIYTNKLDRASIIYNKIDVPQLDKDLIWPFLAISCIMFYRMGKQDTAMVPMETALKLNEIKKAPILKAHAYLYYSFPLLLKKEISVLKPKIFEVISTGEKYSFSNLIANGRLIYAYASYTEFHLEDALTSLDKAVVSFEQLGNPAMAALSSILKQYWLPKTEDSQESVIQIKEALKTIKKAVAGNELYEIGQSILGAVLREHGDFKGAEKNLLASINSSLKKGAMQVYCGSCIQAAKLYFDMENISEGIEYLHYAFDKGYTYSYYMFWDLQYATLVEMAMLAVKFSINGDYAVKLIEKHFGKEKAELLSHKALMMDEKEIEEFSGEFAGQYLNNINSGLPSIKVNFFGEFKVRVNGNYIPEEAWKTKKVKGIFIYLVLYRGKAVSRDYLTALFWPESDDKSASTSFRAALYELKKLISQYGMDSEENKILHESAAGIKISKVNSFITDVDEFNKLNNRIKLSQLGSNSRVIILEKIMSLYKADLLGNEMLDDIILIDREKYKSIFIDSALKLSHEYIKRKIYKKAESTLLKLLRIDCYNEDAALQLINLYISTNQKSRGVKFYSEFKDRLESQLCVKIDSRLTMAVQPIMVK